MKIFEANGHKYSRKQFEEYKFRAKVELKTKEDKYTFLDIYTTDEHSPRVKMVIESLKKDYVESVKVIHWATKEQDELISKSLEEI